MISETNIEFRFGEKPMAKRRECGFTSSFYSICRLLYSWGWCDQWSEVGSHHLWLIKSFWFSVCFKSDGTCFNYSGFLFPFFLYELARKDFCMLNSNNESHSMLLIYVLLNAHWSQLFDFTYKKCKCSLDRMHEVIHVHRPFYIVQPHTAHSGSHKNPFLNELAYSDFEYKFDHFTFPFVQLFFVFFFYFFDFFAWHGSPHSILDYEARIWYE